MITLGKRVTCPTRWGFFMPKIIVDSPQIFMIKWIDDHKNSYPQGYPQATHMQGLCQ